MNGALKSLQLFTGILIGLVGLGAISAGVGYYFFITQMSTHPPKPVFAEEREGVKAAIAAKPKSKAAGVPAPVKSPVAKDPKNPNVIEPLAPDAYDAKVVWKDGLSLKKEPNPGSEKTGGVGFNAKVAIVKTSDDKEWVLIQSETDNLQGWVRAGNIAKGGDDGGDEDADAPKQPKAKR